MAFLPESFRFFSSPVSSAPGFRSYTSGALSSVGNEGSVWSASANGTRGVHLRFVMNAAQPSSANTRGYGFQLRCLSE